MRKLRKTAAAILTAAMTLSLAVMPASAVMHDISAPLPSEWQRTSGEGNANVYYKNGDQMEFIVTEVSEWGGLGSISQNSDSAWEDHLTEFGRLSDVTIADTWEKWYPDMGTATVDTESSRGLHETINGRDYFRYDRSGLIYMNSQAIAAFDNTTFLYGEDGYLYAFYYNGWNYNTDNINDFFSMMNGLSYSGAVSSNTSGTQSTSQNTVTNVNTSTDQGGSSNASPSGYTASSWAKGEIEQAISLGLMPSNLKTADLTQPINRRDFAAVSINVYENMSKTSVSAGSNPFTDTSDTDVLKAYAAGIVNGITDTTFEPSSLLTREQAATMLTRAYKKTVLSGWTLDNDSNFALSYTPSGSFGDSGQISGYARDSVDFMAAKGVVNGMDDGRFEPQSSVTREQALAIAVRMVKNLDTSPQENAKNSNANNASAGELLDAKGTVTYSDMHISFGSDSGQMIVADNPENDGYAVVLTEIPSQPVKLAFDAPAPSDGEVYVTEIGIPCQDADGNPVLFKTHYEAEYKDGQAVTEVDISQFGEIVESTNYSGDFDIAEIVNPMSYFSDWFNSNTVKESAKAGAESVKEDVKAAFTAKSTLAYEKLSSRGHFKIMSEKAYKVSDDDYARIGNDLEDILDKYIELGYTKLNDRFKKNNSKPLPVYGCDLGANEMGRYVAGLGYMNINVAGLTQGYNAKYEGSASSLYATLAHEFFHCVQREYVLKAFQSYWFDEATAAYYENYFAKNKKTSEGKNISNGFDSYFAANALGMHQYKGIVPMYAGTIAILLQMEQERGYGRRPFIEYLTKIAGDDVILKIYQEGGTLLQSSVNDYILKHSNKSWPQLSHGFYEKLLTTKELDASNNDPWNIYTSMHKESDSSYSQVGRMISLGGKEETKDIRFTIDRLGACLMPLDLGSAAASYDSFDIKFSEPETAAILIEMESAYSNVNAPNAYKYYFSTTSDNPDTSVNSLTGIPISAKKYLLAAVSLKSSGTDYAVDLTITLHKDKSGASFGDNNNAVSVSGNVGYMGTMPGGGKKYQDESASASVSLAADGSASLSISSSGYSKSVSGLYYDSQSGTYKNDQCSVWLSFYDNTSNSDREEEMSNAFTADSLGVYKSSGIRAYVYDSSGEIEAVFDGLDYQVISAPTLSVSTEKAQTTVTEEIFKHLEEGQ